MRGGPAQCHGRACGASSLREPPWPGVPGRAFPGCEFKPPKPEASYGFFGIYGPLGPFGDSP